LVVFELEDPQAVIRMAAAIRSAAPGLVDVMHMWYEIGGYTMGTLVVTSP
jgi:hypothetical protein